MPKLLALGSDGPILARCVPDVGAYESSLILALRRDSVRGQSMMPENLNPRLPKAVEGFPSGILKLLPLILRSLGGTARL